MAKTLGFAELQKAGKLSYEAKKYDQALDAFSKAVALARKWSPSDVLPILDQRVAVYVKLGTLDLARKDAMSMIRIDKGDGRGYLRCGQLDRLQDNPSAALRWLEHGMKQVPKSDKLYCVIESQRDKTRAEVQRQLVFSKSRDPVLILPAELLQIILLYLNFIDVVKGLRVSKSWELTLSTLRPLMDTIDFSDAKKVINYRAMVAALKRLGPAPKILVMKDLAGHASELLKINLQRWHKYRHLEKLDISLLLLEPEALPFDKYNLKSLSIRSGSLGGQMVANIMRACPSLETVRFPDVRGFLGHHGTITSSSYEDATGNDSLLGPMVRTLEIGGDRVSVHALTIFPSFFSFFPNLQDLNCHHLRIVHTAEPFDLSALSSLHKLSMSSCDLTYWPKLPPTVELWDNENIKTRLLTRHQAEEFGELPNLRFLRFHKTTPPPPAHCFLPTTATHSITHLDIRGTSIQSEDASAFDLCSAAVSGHLVNLRELAFGGVDDDILLLETLRKFGKVEFLSLTGSRIWDALLVEFMKKCKKSLRQITLIDCPDLHAEVIDWARGRVTVNVRKTG